MGNTRRPERTQQSTAGSKRGTADLEKATTAERRAHAVLAKIRHGLTDAIRTLVTSKTGSSKEDKARRTARAAMKALVMAKKKLRKAQRKRSKAAQRQAHGAGKAAKPVSTRRRAVGAARSRKARPRRVQPERSKVEVPQTPAQGAAMALTRVVSPAARATVTRGDAEPVAQQ
ncbi:MAG TPA: hypothetical protein VN812_12685 [Candidatus Acidoferrales bacterium]|nr:hypothetical protein [Candidatus Acidoferrales bacterium]